MSVFQKEEQSLRMPGPHDLETRTIHLEERRMIADFVEPHRAFKMEAFQTVDERMRELTTRFSGKFFAEIDRRITVKRPSIRAYHSYPRNWWDAFKDRWFPEWLYRRFPSEHVVVDINEPGIDIDEPVYKACYVNLPQQQLGGGITLLEVMKPEHSRSFRSPPGFPVQKPVNEWPYRGDQ